MISKNLTYKLHHISHQILNFKLTTIHQKTSFYIKRNIFLKTLPTNCITSRIRFSPMHRWGPLPNPKILSSSPAFEPFHRSGKKSSGFSKTSGSRCARQFAQKIPQPAKRKSQCQGAFCNYVDKILAFFDGVLTNLFFDEFFCAALEVLSQLPIRGRSQTTLTRFWDFLPPTHLR